MVQSPWIPEFGRRKAVPQDHAAKRLPQQLVGGSEQYTYFPVYRSRDAYANDVILIELFYFLIKILARLVLIKDKDLLIVYSSELYFNTVK